MPDPQPWEPHTDESPKAFAAFAAYRNLPPEKRSIDTAWRRTRQQQLLPGDPELATLKDSRAPKTWRDWSAKFDWVFRAGAWDAEKDRIARLAQLAEHKAMLERHLALSQGMLAKGAEGLQAIAVQDLSAHDVVSLLRFGIDIERRSRLLPEQFAVTVQHTGQVDGTFSVASSPDTTARYDALVDLLLHAPSQAILNADKLSGRVAPHSSLLGESRDPAPGEDRLEESPPP